MGVARPHWQRRPGQRRGGPSAEAKGLRSTRCHQQSVVVGAETASSVTGQQSRPDRGTRFVLISQPDPNNDADDDTVPVLPSPPVHSPPPQRCHTENELLSSLLRSSLEHCWACLLLGQPGFLCLQKGLLLGRGGRLCLLQGLMFRLCLLPGPSSSSSHGWKVMPLEEGIAFHPWMTLQESPRSTLRSSCTSSTKEILPFPCF